jgi:hypothetical protein
VFPAHPALVCRHDDSNQTTKLAAEEKHQDVPKPATLKDDNHSPDQQHQGLRVSKANQQHQGARKPQHDHPDDRHYGEVPASLLIWGLSCKTTFNKELWTSSFPLYSIKPNLRNLFMKKLTRDRVVPIISASVS